MTEKDILYARGRYSVRKARKFNGYEVWKDGICAAERCASIGYPGSEGLNRATAETDKRSIEDERHEP